MNEGKTGYCILCEKSSRELDYYKAQAHAFREVLQWIDDTAALKYDFKYLKDETYKMVHAVLIKYPKDGNGSGYEGKR